MKTPKTTINILKYHVFMQNNDYDNYNDWKYYIDGIY